MSARLVFLNGANAGITFELGEAPVTIGRSPTRTIAFPPDELVVSSEHARIEKRHGDFVLFDEHSTNGTLVNSEHISEWALRNGDLIQFGPGGPSARFVAETPAGVATTDELPVPKPRKTISTRRPTSAMPAIVAAPPDEPPASPQTESRRNFLKVVSVAAGTAAGLLAGVPAVVSITSPVFKEKKAGTWVKLGDTSSFDVGVPNKKDFSQVMKDAWVETQTVLSAWVYTDDGNDFVVYDARCTHLGCGYGYSAETKTFNCPCHGGRFDPKTGAVLAGPPPRPLDRLPTKIEDGVLFAQLS